MKLYYYDHCPFCVRARMVATYKQVKVEEIALLNDDEETCFRLVNAKQVPILEFDDGSAMPESLDIANKFDEIGNKNQKILPQTPEGQAISTHIAGVQKSISTLLYPRNVKIGLPEFATASAIAYYQNKKEKNIAMSFAEALAATSEHQAKVEDMLQTLPPFPPKAANALSWDDVLIFPILRNLTIVKGIKFPKTVRDYIDQIAATTRYELYDNRAL